MARVLSLPNVKGLLLDFDGTLYNCPEYQDHGHAGEIAALAKSLGVSLEAATSTFQETRDRLTALRNRPASRGQTMLALGMTPEWWRDIRLSCWKPEEFLKPNPQLSEILRKLVQHYRIAVVSNSPADLVRRGLSVLGCDQSVPELVLVGPEDSEPKPSMQPYLLAANLLGIPTFQCLSVGDDADRDGYPAIQAGMGAVIVDGPADLLGFLTDLLAGAESPNQWVNWAELVQDWYRPGEIVLCGVTGLSGAGKTTTATNLYNLGRAIGVPTHFVDQDWYFFRSRNQRTAWLLEGKKISQQEYERRSDLLTWWDFERQEADLRALKAGQSLRLRGMYNRPDNGELTLNADIDIDPSAGALVVYDGPALCHQRQYFDHLAFIHTSRPVRHGRLMGRDSHRKGAEAQERIRVTDETWQRYFQGGRLYNADLYVNNDSFPRRMEAPPDLYEL